VFVIVDVLVGVLVGVRIEVNVAVAVDVSVTMMVGDTVGVQVSVLVAVDSSITGKSAMSPPRLMNVWAAVIHSRSPFDIGICNHRLSRLIPSTSICIPTGSDVIRQALVLGSA